MRHGTVVKVKATEAPRRKRRAVSRMESLPQWEMLRDLIDKKLKPNEEIVMEVTPDDREKYGIHSRRTMSRFVSKYIADNERPYRVISFNGDNGDYIIKVQYVPVIAKTA